MPGMKARTHKYNARKTEYNGTMYDSKLEAKLAADIDLLWKTGQLIGCFTQVPFELKGKNGTVVCKHKVDFHLIFRDGHHEIWEAKGYPTPVWRLKHKLFLDNYPHIKYVIHSRAK